MCVKNDYVGLGFGPQFQIIHNDSEFHVRFMVLTEDNCLHSNQWTLGCFIYGYDPSGNLSM